MKLHWFIWFPRIMLIIFALYLIIFAYDVFGGPQRFLDKIESFLLHIIPTIVLLLILWLAWKKPMWCGFLLILVCFIFTVFYHSYKTLMNFVIISGAPFLIGILFIIVHYMHPKKKDDPNTSTGVLS
jgi:hypothetical protein